MTHYLMRHRGRKTPAKAERVRPSTVRAATGQAMSAVIAPALPALTPARIRQVHTLDRAANPESFIHRRAERQLIEALDDRAYNIIALHGASKQGKTTILRSVLTASRPHILVQPGAKITREQLYKSFLTRAHARTTIGETRKALAEGGIFGLKAGGEASWELEPIQGEFSDVNWVADLLIQTTNARILVIDNFHHVDEAVQGELAADFVVWATLGFTILIAGTWKEQDYLVSRNVDLREYYVAISVDPWERDELEAVVLEGASALGVEMQRAISACCARDANGSIAALQLIMQRYYLDRLAGDARYDTCGPLQQVNIAATSVSRERAQTLAKLLVEVSDWGAKDQTDRTQVSFITEALLQATPAELANGFSEKDLKARVDQCALRWAKETGAQAEIMAFSDYMKKIKLDWMAHQILQNNTPIVVYDRTSKRVTVNDAMLIFVHRTSHDLLLNEFRRALRARLH